MKKGTFITNAGRTTGKVAASRARWAMLLVALIAIAGSCGSGKKTVKSTTPPVYSQYQQIFCLNMLSDISGAYSNLSSTALLDSTLKAVDSVLSNDSVIRYIGSWKCVWGPSVYLNGANVNGDSNAAANTMFIARNMTDTTLYVMAIAGTDFISAYDWISEDFDVTYIKYWSNVLANVNDINSDSTGPINSTVPFISRATDIGLYQLMNLHDSSRAGNLTAYQFLTNLAATTSGPLTIWTTGHSLGGALSPALALYLNDTKSTWAPNTTVNLHCLAVAGASPGDSSFSTYYNNRLGANTIRVWNSMDCVPHGFEINMLEQVLGIYSSGHIATPWKIQFAVGSLITALMHDTAKPRFPPVIKYDPYTYTQLYPSSGANQYDTVFTAGYFTASNMLPGNTANPDSFMNQLVCQHVPAYPHYFGVDSFQYLVQRVNHFPHPYFSGGYTPTPITNITVVPRPAPSAINKRKEELKK